MSSGGLALATGAGYPRTRVSMAGHRCSCLIALLAALAASPVTGQVTLFVHAGASLSDLAVSGVGVNGQEGRRGWTGGASLAVPGPGPFALQLEGSYLQKGATFSLVQLGDVELSLDYVQVAALARASFPLGGSRSSVYLLAGPAIARETGCHVTITLALQPITQMGDCDDEVVRTLTKTVDFAVSGGAGVLLAVTAGMGMSLEFRYTRGLRSMYDGELDWTGYNRAMVVRAGLAFSIG